MNSLSFALDEEIVLQNEETGKFYLLVLNQNDKPKSFDVTREWTIQKLNDFGKKTDRFLTFALAASHMQELYQTRIDNGYKEVMRRPNIRKTSQKVTEHKKTRTKHREPSELSKNPPLTVDQLDTNRPGEKIEEMVKSRLRTGIQDRVKF